MYDTHWSAVNWPNHIKARKSGFVVGTGNAKEITSYHRTFEGAQKAALKNSKGGYGRFAYIHELKAS